MASSRSRASHQRIPGSSGLLRCLGNSGFGKGCVSAPVTVKVAVRLPDDPLRLLRVRIVRSAFSSILRSLDAERQRWMPELPDWRLLSVASAIGAVAARFCSNSCGSGDVVDQAPVFRALAAHALGGRTENISEIMTNVSLVGYAGQAAGAG